MPVHTTKSGILIEYECLPASDTSTLVDIPSVSEIMSAAQRERTLRLHLQEHRDRRRDLVKKRQYRGDDNEQLFHEQSHPSGGLLIAGVFFIVAVLLVLLLVLAQGLGF